MVQEPSEVAYVCPGGHLNLTCSTNETFLEWSIAVPGFTRVVRLVDIFGDNQTQEFDPIIVNSNTFNLSRKVIKTMNLSLISVISSRNVKAALNGTTISCSEISANNMRFTILITDIHIIGNEANHGKLS